MLVVVAAVAVADLSRPACCDSDAVDVEFLLYTENYYSFRFFLSAFMSFFHEFFKPQVHPFLTGAMVP